MSKDCKKVCDADKICNPKTGRCVLRRGAIGQEILGVTTQVKPKVKPQSVKVKPQPQQGVNKCYLFQTNPSINPWTGRKIKEGSETYQKLVTECGKPYPSDSSLSQSELNKFVTDLAYSSESPADYLKKLDKYLRLQDKVTNKYKNIGKMLDDFQDRHYDVIPHSPSDRFHGDPIKDIIEFHQYMENFHKKNGRPMTILD